MKTDNPGDLGEQAVPDTTLRKTAMAQRAHEVVVETIAFYTSNPGLRAVTPTSCSYLTEDGRMCAVGRCIRPEMLAGLDYNWNQLKRFNIRKTPEEKEELLKPEYRGLDEGFWLSLQDWHDQPDNWDEAGLTALGRLEADSLLLSNPAP